MNHQYERLKSKRLLALDIGKRRIGIAVCDMFHITTTPLLTLETSTGYIEKLVQIIQKEQPIAIIVGVPEPSEGQENLIREFILSITHNLREYGVPEIIFHDESFSSKDAVSFMVSSGMSKKKRRDKGTIDQTAAAVILRSFLDEYAL